MGRLGVVFFFFVGLFIFLFCLFFCSGLFLFGSFFFFVLVCFFFGVRLFFCSFFFCFGFGGSSGVCVCVFCFLAYGFIRVWGLVEK